VGKACSNRSQNPIFLERGGKERGKNSKKSCSLLGVKRTQGKRERVQEHRSEAGGERQGKKKKKQNKKYMASLLKKGPVYTEVRAVKFIRVGAGEGSWKHKRFDGTRKIRSSEIICIQDSAAARAAER